MQTATIDPKLKNWFDSLPPKVQQDFMADTVRILAQVNGPYAQFKRTYYNDPVAFVFDCFTWKGNEKPTAYQQEILANIPIKKRVAARGPHGLGKTALASWSILWFALTRDGEDWKAPITASAWRQLTKFLLPEVHKWARRLKWGVIGRDPFNLRTELQTLSLKLSTGEAFAASSDDPATLEGAHADRLFYVFDESKAIIDDTFDAAEGAFSGAGDDTGAESYALAISTPGEPAGRFYDIHKRKPGYEDWWVRHVKLQEAIAAGRISEEWAEQRKRQWGEASAVYQNRVAGEFAANEEDTVIPLSWIERANENWQHWVDEGKPGKFTAVGCDVGGGSEAGAKTVMALVYDEYKVDELRKYTRGNPDTATMETAGRVKGILDKAEADSSGDFEGVGVIDANGIGAGVHHRLKEQGVKSLAFVASKKAVRVFGDKENRIKDKTGEFTFANLRSAAWWTMRELLDPANEDVEVCLPPDDELIGELTTPKWSVKSGARIQVESKEDIVKRLKRSTDSADAVIQGIVGADLCKERDAQFYEIEFISL